MIQDTIGLDDMKYIEIKKKLKFISCDKCSFCNLCDKCGDINQEAMDKFALHINEKFEEYTHYPQA